MCICFFNVIRGVIFIVHIIMERRDDQYFNPLFVKTDAASERDVEMMSPSVPQSQTPGRFDNSQLEAIDNVCRVMLLEDFCPVFKREEACHGVNNCLERMSNFSLSDNDLSDNTERCAVPNSDAYSDITNSTDSRPGSSLQIENEFLNSFRYVKQEDVNDPPPPTVGNSRVPSTYFVSLPNSHDWSIVGRSYQSDRDYGNRGPGPLPPLGSFFPVAGSRNSRTAGGGSQSDCSNYSSNRSVPSPLVFFSPVDGSNSPIAGEGSRADRNNYGNNLAVSPLSLDSLGGGSRNSPFYSELSFYEDLQRSNGPETVPAGPPPPYRPPVPIDNPEPSLNCDIFPGNAELSAESADVLLGRLTPPPPYERTATPGKNHLSTNPARATVSPSGKLEAESRLGVSQLTAETDRSPAVVNSPGSCHGQWDVCMPTPPAEVEAQAGEEDCFAVGISGSEGELESSEDEDSKVFVPADPEEWNEEHISRWLQWTQKQFGIGPVDRSRMPTDGPTLCKFTAEDFRRATGDKKASEILITHLAHLKQASGHSPKNVQEKPTNNAETEINQENSTNSFDVKDLYEKYVSQDNKSPSTSGGGQFQLWQFLLELLSDPENSSIITWQGEEGEFRFVDPEEVAKRWGERKSKPNMNYDKLSRALRYYYDKGIMSKVFAKRYTYRFDFQGLARACQPSGVSDTCFIQPDFAVEDCDYSSVRNFSFHNLLTRTSPDKP